MGETIGWGILGPGRIAARFAEDLRKAEYAHLVAVGSRSQEKARVFAEQHGASRAYGSYEALIADPDVDIIYIATPHPFHRAHTVACLEGGKAVLCEKPMGVNAGDVRAMVDCARERALFLMEGMWTRFLPVTEKVREWLRWGVIGDVRMLSAELGFRTAWNPDDRLLNLNLAGGAVLDVGVYTIAYASMVFGGQPTCVQAWGHLGETGVDEQTGMVFGYDNGAMAMLACAVRTEMSDAAHIYGVKGHIDVESFFRSCKVTLYVDGLRPVEFSGQAGYHYEAMEVMRCLRAGKQESRTMPLDESIAIAETIDRVKEQIGLRYPTESREDG